MRLIGSPFVEDGTDGQIEDPISMYNYAANNRIRLLGVSAILKKTRNAALEKKLSELLQRYEKTLGVFTRVSGILDEAGVAYAFFKSVRPYQEATVDLDVIIFGSDHGLAVSKSVEGDLLLLEEGPLSTTLCDQSVPLNVDLYNEIGVSKFIYLDKDKLAQNVTTQEVGEGINVRTLDSKGDLLALITHSMVKEQMYVLSEYYTTLGFLNRMSNQELSDFVRLAKECSAEYEASIHLNIAATLHNSAHGFVPEKLNQLIGKLNPAAKVGSMISKNLEMPHKYSSSIVIRSLVEKLEEKKAARSLLSQARGMLNPRFSSVFLGAILDHFTRETY